MNLAMMITFTGPMIYWRGPSPWFFLPVKASVRKAGHLEEGDLIDIELEIHHS